MTLTFGTRTSVHDLKSFALEFLYTLESLKFSGANFRGFLKIYKFVGM